MIRVEIVEESGAEVRILDYGGGIFPEGEIEIDENGTYDVKDKATAVVAVPLPPDPVYQQKTVAENGTYDVTDKATAVVAVPVTEPPEEYPTDGALSDGSATGYVFKQGTESIHQYMFTDMANFFLSELPNSVITIGDRAFQGTRINLTKLPDALETIGAAAFYNCSENECGVIPASVKTIGSSAFRGNAFTVVRFLGTPTTVPNNAFTGNNQITDIYVPWAKGAVANAPWGAPASARIHYESEG